ANIGVITSGVVVGIILARTVAGAVADLAGWRAVYAGSTLISVLIAALALTMLPKDPRSHSDRGSYVGAMGSVVTLTL
ncbi:MFS transporter, partial [Rhodococcus erythropolis]|nr:MFS transporter [Rhodococcus erythropolis]